MLQEECAHFRKIAQFYQSNSPWILAVNIGRDKKKMFNGFEINMQDLLLSTASSQEFQLRRADGADEKIQVNIMKTLDQLMRRHLQLIRSFEKYRYLSDSQHTGHKKH